MRQDVATAATPRSALQYDGGKLGHVAGIDAIQYRIDQGAVVVAGIEDLMQDPDCQHAVGGSAPEPYGESGC
jgi:hypothetical protein